MDTQRLKILHKLFPSPAAPTRSIISSLWEKIDSFCLFSLVGCHWHMSNLLCI